MEKNQSTQDKKNLNQIDEPEPSLTEDKISENPDQFTMPTSPILRKRKESYYYRNRKESEGMNILEENLVTNSVINKNEEKSLHNIRTIKDIFKNAFIGEFESNYNFKVLRAYINKGGFDRIFYTKLDPIDKESTANILMVHGYGHSGNLIEVI